ncbi:DUF7935 family protein [Pedobacter caeni]|uniref:Uncharacterized protein n=1 Tax=Pedobacter caeni TaxID=288992 RepID=A0A1M5N6X6_9SPHI|nr:hypothetical protein [Pedobacter caeni]SHG85304.1 hypothetical protein SAMN04488522_10813 [Pedobacter caeni]
MNIESLLTETAALSIAGVVTVSVGYYLVKGDIQTWFRLKSAGQPQNEKAQLLPLRLQAHERLIVFIERINPSNLFLRLHHQGIAVKDLQSLALNEIRAEYQHNVTQQLYVTESTWNVIRKLKDDTLAMVSNAAKDLPEHSTGIDLSRKVLQHMAGIADNPYELTLDLIKKDIHQLF